MLDYVDTTTGIPIADTIDDAIFKIYDVNAKHAGICQIESCKLCKSTSFEDLLEPSKVVIGTGPSYPITQ